MESSLSSDKETLLELCLSYNSNIDVVKLLMSEYDINVVSKTKLQILLHSAAKNNTIVEVIQVLIKAGADVKAKDKNDLTSLEFTAVNNPSADVLRMLLKACPNMPSSQMQDLLFSTAEQNPSGSIVKLMVDKSNDAKAALFIAVNRSP